MQSVGTDHKAARGWTMLLALTSCGNNMVPTSNLHVSMLVNSPPLLPLFVPPPRESPKCLLILYPTGRMAKLQGKGFWLSSSRTPQYPCHSHFIYSSVSQCLSLSVPLCMIHQLDVPLDVSGGISRSGGQMQHDKLQ